MPRINALACLIVCLPAAAGADLACSGDAPVWHADIRGETATLTFRGAARDFDIPSVVEALNDPDVRAYSLIGNRDTAILIVAPGRCNATDLTGHLLTQENSTPVVLTGCCTRP